MRASCFFAKGHFEFIADPGHEECSGFGLGAVGWKVVVRTPQHGADDCVWISSSPAEQCGNSGNPYAAFLEFGPHATALDDDDSSIANKGVAFVNLLDTETGIRHAIFITHLQAYYGPDDPELIQTDTFAWHGDEFQTIADFHDCLVHESVFVPELDHVYVMGDLNVEGDQLALFDSLNDPPGDNKGEWTNRIANNSFLDGLVDAWIEETPAGLPTTVEPDRGLSAGSTRVDYILHRQPTAEPDNILCNQHMTLAYNLRDYSEVSFEGGMDHGGRGPTAGDGLQGFTPSDPWHSDHYGVNANYNQCSTQCTPLDDAQALALYGDEDYAAHPFSHAEVGNDPMSGDPDPSSLGTWHNGQLLVPGALGWWRLNHAGQYLIGFSQESLDAGFRLSVYHISNMSQPIKDNRDERFTVPSFGAPGVPQHDAVGSKFMLLEPPYFIKVYHPDHNHTGSYNLFVHRLTCANKYAMACLMYPNQPNGNVKFPAGLLVPFSSPSADSFYFHFDIQTQLTNTSQNARTVVSNYTQNKIGTFIVGPHSDTTLTQYEPLGVPPGWYSLNNTTNTQRQPMNGFPVSNLTWPTCPSLGGAGTMGFDHFGGCNNVLKMTVSQPTNPLGDRLFLRVTRVTQSGTPVSQGGCGMNGVNCPEIRFEYTWQTNLTALPVESEYGNWSHPDFGTNFPDHRLFCDNQEDDTTSTDEMRLRMLFDSVWYAGYEPGDWGDPSHPPGSECSEFDAFWVGEMDNGADASNEAWLSDPLDKLAGLALPDVAPRRFTGELQVDLVEEDDCPEGGEEPASLPEEATLVFPALSIDDFEPGLAFERVRKPFPEEFVAVGAGDYFLELNLTHGTQPWEDEWSKGNIALTCNVGSVCTLTASTNVGSNVKERGVDASGSTFYESISTSGAFWQARFNQDTFVGTVRLKGTLSNCCVGLSTNGTSFYEKCWSGSFPGGSGYLDLHFGMPRRYVRVKRTGTGSIRLADLHVLGY
jgi:hypothetical protein